MISFRSTAAGRGVRLRPEVDRTMATRRRAPSAGRALVAACVALAVPSMAAAQAKQYPPQSAYLMEPDAEIALAKSAAPAHISDKASIKVLTPHGYDLVHQGENGFVCMVMRGWGNSGTYTPVQFRELGYDSTVRAPICFTPGAARVVMPYVEMKDTLGLQGKTPDEIAEAVQKAYTTGKLPQRNEVTFAYMWSAVQNLNSGKDHEGTSLRHGWHPHMMIYAPYYENAMLGDNDFGGSPIVGDDAGTPFAVIYISLDHALAVQVRPK